jgi:hypothetical protein
MKQSPQVYSQNDQILGGFVQIGKIEDVIVMSERGEIKAGE